MRHFFAIWKLQYGVKKYSRSDSVFMRACSNTDRRLQNRDKAVVRHTYELGSVILYFQLLTLLLFFTSTAMGQILSSAQVWRQTVESALGTTGTSGLYNVCIHYSSS